MFLNMAITSFPDYLVISYRFTIRLLDGFVNRNYWGFFYRQGPVFFTIVISR